MRSLFLAALAFAALLSLSASASATAPVAPAGRLEFEMLRNGHPDGRHSVIVTRNGSVLEVSSQVSVRVRAGFITLFDYEQSCRENWTRRILNALTCSTLKDGRRLDVSARSTGSRMLV